MGMYTTMILDLTLDKDVPHELIDIIKFLSGGLKNRFENSIELKKFKDHAFFKCERWADVGMVMQDHSKYRNWSYDGFSTKLTNNPDGSYHLESISVIKNYDSELENFLDLIHGYAVHDREVYGWYGYEEWYTISEIINSADTGNFEFRDTNMEDFDNIEKDRIFW